MGTVSHRDLLGARKSLESSVNQVVDATRELLEPLRQLNDEQRDAVVMLGLLMQGFALTRRPPARLREDISVRFQEQLDGICPPLGTAVIAKDPCFEATVAYVSALVDCEEDGRDEDECYDAWGPGFAAVTCAMEKIEQMKAEIGVMLARQEPPRPIPWPIEHLMP